MVTDSFGTDVKNSMLSARMILLSPEKIALIDVMHHLLSRGRLPGRSSGVCECADDVASGLILKSILEISRIGWIGCADVDVPGFEHDFPDRDRADCRGVSDPDHPVLLVARRLNRHGYAVILAAVPWCPPGYQGLHIGVGKPSRFQLVRPARSLGLGR